MFVLGDIKELTIKGGHLGPNCWPKAIDMLAKGLLPMDKIVTNVFPMEDYMNGLDYVTNSQKSIKVMLTP